MVHKLDKNRLTLRIITDIMRINHLVNKHIMHFFLHNKFLGQADCPSVPFSCARARAQPDWEPDIAFFCPRCGDVWARAIANKGFEWLVLTKYCLGHGDGSLLMETWTDLNLFSRDFLLNELIAGTTNVK